MKIYVTNAGECKSVVIVDGDESVVIDGGATDAYASLLPDRVTPSELLTLAHVKHLRGLICTKPDVEHLAGLYEAARTVSVDSFVIGTRMLEWLKALEDQHDPDARERETLRIFKQLHSALLRKHSAILEVSAEGMELTPGQCRIRCSEELSADGIPGLAVKITWDENELILGAPKED